MEGLRDHHAVERIGMIRKIRQCGDPFDVIAADRQFRKTSEPERRTRGWTGRLPLRYLIAISQVDAALTYSVFSGCSINAVAVAER